MVPTRRRDVPRALPGAVARDGAGRWTAGDGSWLGLRIAVLVAVFVAMATLVVTWHGTTNDPETGGYPQRIGFERPSDPLPERPGPLAATMYDNDFGNRRTVGVTSSGHLWELPMGANVLSPSGTLLLSQEWDREDRLIVQHLLTGDREELDGVAPTWLGGSPRAFWSEDETAVLTDFGKAAHPRRRHPAVLDLATGDLVEVGGDQPAGFRSPSEVVTVRRAGGSGTAGGIVAISTDLDTGATDELRLRLAGPWRGSPDAPLVASIAPDGQSLLLVEVASGEASTATVRVFSMADGVELAPHSVSDWDGCSPTWRGDDPVLPTSSVLPSSSVLHGSSRVAGAAALTGGGPVGLVAVHPRLQSSCLQLTADALGAGPRWSLFGSSTALWTWYWFPALVGASLLLVGLSVAIRTARRSRSRRRASRRDVIHPGRRSGRLV